MTAQSEQTRTERVREIIAEREAVIGPLKEILTQNLGLRMPVEMIDLDVPMFGSGLGLDSVDALELVVAVEDIMGMRIPQSVVRPALRTLNTLVDMILAMRQEPRQESGT